MGPGSAAPLVERAPAKINLSLAVLGRRADGYHCLDSLVAFARVADEVRLDPNLPEGLLVRGPTAAASGDPAGNLVLRAASELRSRVIGLRTGRFTLLKRLPVAAGIGGGSSDAGAAFRLLARLNELPLDDPRIIEAAKATGSDVPVCVAARARHMSGAGEVLSHPVDLAAMPAILVNPGVPTPTGPVFKALGLAPGENRSAAKAGTSDLDLATRRGLLAALATAVNDLEAPAIALEPKVGEALSLVRAAGACRLARMSGSGATVFGLFDSCRAAAAAAKTVRAARPNWWVAATMIG